VGSIDAAVVARRPPGRLEWTGRRVEEYGLIGDMESAALVGRSGAIDWLCLPRFDSASFFSALVADEQHGRWLLAPAGEVTATARRYRPGALVLQTEFETAEGAVRRGGVLGRRPFCVRSGAVAAPNLEGTSDA
jgi:GH15 family glucan-1,4-alpha-glucosidase